MIMKMSKKYIVIEVNHHNKLGLTYNEDLNINTWLNNNIRANYKILQDSNYDDIDGDIDIKGELQWNLANKKKYLDYMYNPTEIKYKNWKGTISNRIILPINTWYGESEFHQGKQWFLEAYDMVKKANRNFAIKDILEYIPHEKDWYKNNI